MEDQPEKSVTVVLRSRRIRVASEKAEAMEGQDVQRGTTTVLWRQVSPGEEAWQQAVGRLW